MSGLPNFDDEMEQIKINEESSADIKSIHTRAPSITEEFPCDQCDRVFQNKAGLGGHKAAKHKVDIKKIMKNDIIRVAFFTGSTKPVYDKKLGFFVYEDENIKIPDEFSVYSLDRDGGVMTNSDGVLTQTINAVLVRSDKLGRMSA